MQYLVKNIYFSIKEKKLIQLKLMYLITDLNKNF